jgi:D-alanyl-D-alanine carboxypeptidase
MLLTAWHDVSRDDLRDRLGTLLDAHIHGREIAAIAVARGDPPRTAAAWVPSSLAAEPSFLTYSVTKIFTATLILMLEEDGRLSLDEALLHWFPNIDRSPRITIRRLLNHTAGLPDYGGLRAYHDAVRASPGTPWSFEEFAAHTYEGGLLFEPGTGWAYSNPGYMLLKRIAEQVGCASYAQLIQTRVALPLQLKRTHVVDSIVALEPLAPARSRFLGVGRDTREVTTSYHPGWVSHGVVASTPSEVGAFCHALFSGRLVSARSMGELTSLVPVPNAPSRWRKPSYGLGIMADPESPFGPLWGHNGGGPGYSTSVFHAPWFHAGPVTVCVMCTVEEDSLGENLLFAAFELL